MTDWQAGMKCVCVDDTPTPNPGHPPLVLNRVYTVATVSVFKDMVHLGLEEHLLPFRTNGGGCHWLWESRRFRPLVARPTSIEIFKKMLLPAKEDA